MYTHAGHRDMLPEITQEESAAALDAVAMDVLAEARIARPPVDAFQIARALGITVALDDRQHTRARLVRLKDYRARRSQPTILLRPEPRSQRRQWAVAHEISEHVAWRLFAALGIDPRETGPTAREAVANSLAARLLLPSPWFAADAAGCAWDLVRLKTRYPTASHELIARRMLDLPPPVIISIFDHQQLTFRRSNLPGRVPPPREIEMQCWRAAHNDNCPRQAYDGLQTVCCWPVHEEGWKREVLRAEVEELV